MFRKLSFLLIVVSVLAVTNLVSAAWSDPPLGTPPTCPSGYPGCDAPINVSSIAQLKQGGFGILGLLAPLGKLFVANDPLATSPDSFRFASTTGYDASFVFKAQGNIGAEKYCDENGLNCKTILEMGNATSTTGGGGGDSLVDLIATSDSHNGNFGGYKAMSDWVQAHGAPGYHVCSGAEVSRWLQAGNALPTARGWVSTGQYSVVMTNPSTYTTTDCDGWSNGNVGTYGPMFIYTVKNFPSVSTCDVTYQVFACKSGDGSGGTSGGGGAGVYVGATAATYNGLRGGYAAADALCANDPKPALAGSRVCNGADFSNGLPNATGWFNAFSVSTDNNTLDVSTDCLGWSTGAGGVTGNRWRQDQLKVSTYSCGDTNPFLCCKPSSGGGGASGVTSLTAGAGITLTPNPITTTGTIAVTPAAPNPSGEGIMYLRSKSETGYTPNNCPATWTEADGKLEYVGMSENNGGLWSNMVRTCYTNNYCRVMYLRSKVESGYIPNNCPGAWSEADMKIEYAYISHAGGTISNWVRTCYKCN